MSVFDNLLRYRNDPIAFIEEVLVSPYDGKPYRLVDAEKDFIKQMFQFDDDGRLLFPLLIYSAIKKSRKTELAALLIITVILLFGGKYAEAYIAAVDREQAQDRCFAACCRIIEASPTLRKLAKITSSKIVFSNSATITAISSDPRSIAGGHPTISVFDEMWAMPEKGRDLWSALIPVPSQRVSCRLVVSHAGGEGTLLHDLYKRGMSQPEVGADLHAGNGLLMHWSHRPLHFWQNEKWLEEMKRELQPHEYHRWIENEFASAEDQFINMADWDACIEEGRGRAFSNQGLACFAAVDASLGKQDSTALALVGNDVPNETLYLLDHRIIPPSPNQSPPFDAIEGIILNWHANFHLKACFWDSFQMSSTAQRLQLHYVPMREYSPTHSNLTAMAETLISLVRYRRLRMYADPGIREAVANCILAEDKGVVKIAKRTKNAKIDIVVAIAMAAIAATRHQGISSYNLWALADMTPPSNNKNEDQRARSGWDWQRLRKNLYITSAGTLDIANRGGGRNIDWS